MKIKPIIVVAGEPYSVFFEIFFKTLKNKNIKKIKSPILLIGSKSLLYKQMKSLKYNFSLNEFTLKNIGNSKLENSKINILNVKFNGKKTFDKISKNSNMYIKNCCEMALKLVRKTKAKVLINGPVSKKYFLKNKFPGMTEYFAAKTGYKNSEVMLIYNKENSVSPITTHIPLKKVVRFISKENIIKNIITINNFYKKYLKKTPSFAITGVNPHCESTDRFSEEDKIILPAIKILKRKKINISGPYPADTIFLKKNLKKYDIFIGMYHDQVLTPIKTIYEFEAINITLGLPFIRITPDHGPNNFMIGTNKSNPNSLIKAFEFAQKIK
tara:strand:- start:645 stop:1625 length:981 start_codon:yes stop_codon:yes gene_type:complete